ncbi:hypothetical protein NDU88_005079 [Pleurodeles waltl]|uniref:Uncharacterized protein n=1 Tax=Pleurodeles waltl TaxID=8319 RepID=A0AAV7MA65_PLEWA|nr:hypothetical protein NDU88_005079 [Pleurodeles waltl]
MESALGFLVSELSYLKDNHQRVPNWVSEGEKTLDEIQPQTASNQSAIQDLQERIWMMAEREEDADGHARRSNMQILEILEGQEDNDPLKSLETWFRSFVPALDLTSFFSLEQAHRFPDAVPHQRPCLI